MSQMGQANFNLALEGLQGNVGGPVYSDALGMINIIGGAGFLVTGVPATSTLTITGPGFISQVDADAGNALPVAGIIALAGGLNIATAAAGNMVTINVDGTTDHCVQLGNAGGSLTSMAAGVNGQTIMGVTGADPTWTNSPQFGGSVTALNDITSTAGNVVSIGGNLISRDATNTAAGPNIIFQKVRVAAIIQTGDSLGNLNYTGYDGVNYHVASQITSTSSGTIGANRIPSDLKFYTHPDAVGVATLRMTIASTGAITVAALDGGAGVPALTITDSGLTVTAGDIIASTNNITATLGIIQGPTIRTGDPAVIAAGLSANASTITAIGTGANVDIGLTTQGTGGIKFRGIAAGYTGSEWYTKQAGLQTANAVATPIIQIVVPLNTMLMIKACVNTFKSTFDAAGNGEILASFYRTGAGAVVLVGETSSAWDDNIAGGLAINAAIDGVNPTEAQITVTGIAAETWNWVTTYSYMFLSTNA